MIIHDENREREVQVMCRSILETGLDFEDDPNGPYIKSCPYCYARITGGWDFIRTTHGMEDIVHETDCIYLIAKSLVNREKIHKRGE